MQYAQGGVVAFMVAAAGIGGGSYVVSGSRDFTVEIGRPMPEVYEEFNGIRTFGSGLRNEGFDVPEMTVSRPSDHELVFTAPSANPDQSSRIAFTFEPGANPATTRVTATIDVPPIQSMQDGQRMYLSEAKVETGFKEAITEMAKQMNSGNSTTAAAYNLKIWFDSVAIASHPEILEKYEARIEQSKARVDAINADLRKEHEARRARWDRDQAAGMNVRYGEPTDGRQRTDGERYGYEN